MLLDLDKLTRILNTSVKEIKEISEEEKENPQMARDHFLNFIPTVMDGYKELSTASFEDIKASASNPQQLDNIQSAIQTFLTGSKEAQEKAGFMQAILLSDPTFKDFTHRLQDLSNFLKRGERVEKVDNDGL